MPRLIEALDDEQLAILEQHRQDMPSGPHVPAMAYAKAFQDLETGEVWFLRFHGFKGGGQTRKGMKARPSRFLGDAFVTDTPGWSESGLPKASVFEVMPYPIDETVQ